MHGNVKNPEKIFLFKYKFVAFRSDTSFSGHIGLSHHFKLLILKTFFLFHPIHKICKMNEISLTISIKYSTTIERRSKNVNNPMFNPSKTSDISVAKICLSIAPLHYILIL
jgi:hypothetical protein